MHTMTAICKLIGILAISLEHCIHGNLRSLATIDLGQARCEDKPSPACEHAVPGTRTELLIRTIAETSMALWAGQVNYDKSHWLI